MRLPASPESKKLLLYNYFAYSYIVVITVEEDTEKFFRLLAGWFQIPD